MCDPEFFPVIRLIPSDSQVSIVFYHQSSIFDTYIVNFVTFIKGKSTQNFEKIV